MNIQKLLCYEYDDFFDNIYNIYMYRGEDLNHIDDTAIEMIKDDIDIIPEKSLCYMNLYCDFLNRQYYMSDLIERNFHDYFPLYEEFCNEENFDIYKVFNNDQTEWVYVILYKNGYQNCKIMFGSYDPMKVLDEILVNISDMVNASMCLYVPKLHCIENFKVLDNSPPYFYITDINDVEGVEQGNEYVVIPKDAIKDDMRYIDYIKTIETLDCHGNEINTSLFRVTDQRFFNYIKIQRTTIYCYILAGKHHCFLAN